MESPNVTRLQGNRELIFNLGYSFLLKARSKRHQCLAYIKPWIPNLRLFCRSSGIPEANEKFLKTKEIINSFITLTLREGHEVIVTWILKWNDFVTWSRQIGPAIANLVWKRIGRVPELLDLVIELFIERITETKSWIGTKTMEAIEDMSVALASQNAQLVTGKVLARVILVNFYLFHSVFVKMLRATNRNSTSLRRTRRTFFITKTSGIRSRRIFVSYWCYRLTIYSA